MVKFQFYVSVNEKDEAFERKDLCKLHDGTRCNFVSTMIIEDLFQKTDFTLV